MGKKTSRRVFVIIFFIGVLVTVIYLWAYFRPQRNRIDEMRQDVVARYDHITETYRRALERNRIYEALLESYEYLSVEWAIEEAVLPDRFYDTAVLRHIYEVIYPHTNPANPTISLSFGVSEEREGDALWSTRIELEFETSYWQFLAILYNLVQGELGNRVVEYEFNVEPMAREQLAGMLTFEGPLGYSWALIPEHLRRQFHPAFIAGEDVLGLYMLDVTMTVEYLTLEPGILPEAVAREQWEADDEAAALAAAPPEAEYSEATE